MTGTENIACALVVQISDDQCSAHVNLDPGSPLPSRAELDEALCRAGVVSGICSEDLDSIACGRAQGAQLLVARGDRPEKGADGRLEWHFSPEPGAPALFRNTRAGEKLASIYPPSEGRAGMSVQGKSLPAPNGKPARLRPGVNTVQKSGDPPGIYATADGNIEINGDLIEVHPVVTIRGNIDYSTGAVDFVGSLIVGGDIRSETSVRVKGSLTVHGNVEDSLIEVGGDVRIDKGFVGRGKGKIVAGGNIHVLHILNQSVQAGGDVAIGKESVNGTINATGRVTSPAAVIAGGTVLCDGDIELRSIGSTDGSQAKVRAGRRGRILERIPALEKEIKQAENQANDVKDAVYRLVRLQIDVGTLPGEKKEMLDKLQAVQKLLPERLAALRAEIQKLKEDLKKNHDIKLVVRGTVFENSMIELNGVRKLIDTALQDVVFYERGGAIEVRSR
ncbi:MAG TPA: FapA family protein [Bacteroidota bacterium]|nr:FapA family protein [Bacteroidota bacterium]